MLGKLDQTFRFHETALSLRAQRQQLLASNIANADTPNYKARDVDFGKALQSALTQAGQPTPANGQPRLQASHAASSSLALTSALHLAPKTGPSVGGTDPQYRKPAQGSIDGNTVDMDVERNQFTDNALRYEAGVTFVAHQVKGLLTAIQGQ